MRILFVWAKTHKFKFEGHGSDKNFFTNSVSKIFSITPPKPLTFMILAALTPEKHSVELIEGGLNDINFDEKYDLVGITCITKYAHAAYEVADEFRKRGVTVVLGGWHPSALPLEAKQHASSVVIGEAEEIWPQLLRDFENGKLQPFYEQARPVDPRIIPHPRTDIYPKGSEFVVQATRGCPNRCEFCAASSTKFGALYRTRPIEDVVEEIKSLPNKGFFFHDNSLTVNPNYTKQLFREIRGLNKKFGAYGNIDVLGGDEEFLKLASEAGCICWEIGFESICQESIYGVGKKTNLVNKYISTVKKIHDHGMIVIGSFVFGFDTDTIDIFDKTIEFVNKSEIDVLPINILTPFPGTPLYNRLDSEGRIFTKDWSKYDLGTVVFQPKNMTPEELTNNTIKLYNNWYAASATLGRIIRSIKFGFYSFSETTALNIYWKFSGYH
ncbi:MAG: radical SAM protein [Euryarchaeota archaeon]|nr:radical SAM protein [Euryarchaeota archaeon]